MPFPLRTVEPLKLCRLEEGDGAERGGPAPGDHAGAAEGGGGRRRGAVPQFGALEQVSSYALVSLLMQLSDLSRCAGDIFGGILSEADTLCHRNARLQRRLGALEALLARLDHRKVKIREWLRGAGGCAGFGLSRAPDSAATARLCWACAGTARYVETWVQFAATSVVLLSSSLDEEAPLRAGTSQVCVCSFLHSPGPGLTVLPHSGGLGWCFLDSHMNLTPALRSDRLCGCTAIEKGCFFPSSV